MTGIKAKMRTGSEGAGTRHAEWEVVQKELEAERRQREEARRAAAEGGEKSLYEVLQANKGGFLRANCRSGFWGGRGGKASMVYYCLGLEAGLVEWSGSDGERRRWRSGCCVPQWL